MNNYTRHMNQVATYWAISSSDRFGKQVFASPVEIMCRWQDVAVLFKDANGQQRTSSAVIYPDRALSIKGYIKRGSDSSTDPVVVAGAFEILNSGDSPSLNGTITLNKVFV